MSKDNKELCDSLAEQLIESGVDLSQMFYNTPLNFNNSFKNLVPKVAKL